MEADNVYKIATDHLRVRGFFTKRDWEFTGVDEDMDSFRNRKTRKQLWMEDVSENFPVTFVMGDLSLDEFRELARELTPGVGLLEVDSSWEGEPTTIVVAMTEEQVKDMFGRKARMRPVAVQALGKGR